jgi:hypothetical protein
VSITYGAALESHVSVVGPPLVAAEDEVVNVESVLDEDVIGEPVELVEVLVDEVDVVLDELFESSTAATAPITSTTMMMIAITGVEIPRPLESINCDQHGSEFRI